MSSVSSKAATAAAGGVLLTLCAGQFLMMLDSSVMNVSIATVAKDVGTTVTGIQTAITLVHAGDGRVHDHRWKGRADHRAQARLRDRVRDLRLRLVHHRDLYEPRGTAARVVLPRGDRCSADPAVDRCAGGGELRSRRTAARLRAHRRGDRDRDRGRPDRRRPVHHLPLMALGVRGRGRDRAGDPRPCPPDTRGAAREGWAPRPRGYSAVRGSASG